MAAVNVKKYSLSFVDGLEVLKHLIAIKKITLREESPYRVIGAEHLTSRLLLDEQHFYGWEGTSNQESDFLLFHPGSLLVNLDDMLVIDCLDGIVSDFPTAANLALIASRLFNPTFTFYSRFSC